MLVILLHNKTEEGNLVALCGKECMITLISRQVSIILNLNYTSFKDMHVLSQNV